MGQYTQYIQEHINNFNGQLPFHWKTSGYWRRLETVCSRYREMHGTNDLFESIERLGNDIGREDVRNLFLEGNFYDGYVATMLWGRIDLTRYNDIQETNGYKALTIKKDVIVEKLKRVSDLLIKNDLPNAFLSFLDNSENRIEGIALSYFTKLLFFLPNNISPKPLIYDKWGIRIHAALMKDENIDYDNFLSIFDPQPYVRGGNDRNVLLESYLEYCSRINNLYDSLNIDSSKDIEAFLFGMPLRGAVGNNPELNPRKMLKDFLGLNDNIQFAASQSIYNRHVSSPNLTNQTSRVTNNGISVVQNTHEIFLNKKYSSLFITKGIELTYRDVPILVYYGADRSNGKTKQICKVSIKDEAYNTEELFCNTNVLSLLNKGRNPYYKYQICATETEANNLWKDVLQELNVRSDLITSE